MLQWQQVEWTLLRCCKMSHVTDREFAKYEEMGSTGVSAHDVYTTAKADGIDPIKMIRLLRHVFGLSLAEAKRVTEATDDWSAKQKVAPGAIFYWEGSTNSKSRTRDNLLRGLTSTANSTIL
jgi:hypothetical protein